MDQHVLIKLFVYLLKLGRGEKVAVSGGPRRRFLTVPLHRPLQRCTRRSNFLKRSRLLFPSHLMSVI